MKNVQHFPLQYVPIASDGQIFGIDMSYVEAVHQLRQYMNANNKTVWRSSERVTNMPVIDLRTLVGQTQSTETTSQQALLLKSSLGKFAVAIERIHPTHTIQADHFYDVPVLLSTKLYKGIVDDLDTLVLMLDVEHLAQLVKDQEPEWLVSEG